MNEFLINVKSNNEERYVIEVTSEEEAIKIALKCFFRRRKKLNNNIIELKDKNNM